MAQQNKSLFPGSIDSFTKVASGSPVMAEHINLLADSVMESERRALRGLVFTDKDAARDAELKPIRRRVINTTLCVKMTDSQAELSSLFQQIDVDVKDEDGKAIEGIWSAKDWAVYVEVYSIRSDLKAVPLPGDPLPENYATKFEQLRTTYTILDYDTTSTTAKFRVKRKRLKNESILIAITAVSLADQLPDVKVTRLPYPDGGVNTWTTPGSGDGLTDLGYVTATRLGPNILSGSGFNDASDRSHWRIKPSMAGKPGSSFGWVYAVRRSPNWKLSKDSPLYTTNWENYRWESVIIPTDSRTPRSISTYWEWLEGERGAVQTANLVNFSGGIHTISSIYELLTIELDWHYGAYNLSSLSSQGKDQFYPYVHVYWFTSAHTRLGRTSFRLTGNKISYTGDFKSYASAPFTHSVLEAQPPIGAQYAVVALMLMVDEPIGPKTEDYRFCFKNVSACLWRKEIII